MSITNYSSQFDKGEHSPLLTHYQYSRISPLPDLLEHCKRNLNLLRSKKLNNINLTTALQASRLPRKMIGRIIVFQTMNITQDWKIKTETKTLHAL
jgi:hypothetical protein